MKRLDALLSGARSFHYLNIIITGIALGLSTLEALDGFKLPIGDVVLPSTQTAVGLYLISISLAIGADRLYLRAQQWMPMDPRRPQFAWIALGSTKTPDRRIVLLWLLSPVALTAFAVSLTLEPKLPDAGFLLPGLLLGG